MKVEYTVVTKTGDKIGAGTDAKVYIIIYGEKEQTEKINLSKDKDPFEKGKEDSFKIHSKNVGDIKKINISHDGKNIGDGWYLDSVKVTVNGKSYE